MKKKRIEDIVPHKVWIALQVFAFEGNGFLGAAESMEAAKKLAGSGRNWVDNPNAPESIAKVRDGEWFTVFETDVAT